jgi:hypothetical protein
LYKIDDGFNGDGYSEMDGSCDDNNILFSPETQELFDGVDNNCDVIAFLVVYGCSILL